jgi:Ca2+/Na+ antiporter
MNSFVDTIMIVLFVLFMIFIFGGYHKNKSAQREKDREVEEKKSNSDS